MGVREEIGRIVVTGSPVPHASIRLLYFLSEIESELEANRSTGSPNKIGLHLTKLAVDSKDATLPRFTVDNK
jgi:hypothetical protein